MNRVARYVAILGLFIYGVFASSAVSQTATSNVWSPAGQLTQARTGAAAVLLNDGRVLITGGTDSSGLPLATTEMYDTATGAFTAAPSMNAPRANHAAIVLKTGDVLVTGGLTTGGNYSDSAEIYSVSSKQWVLLQSSIGIGLKDHAMAQLSDGNILIAGGTSTAKVVGSLLLFNLTDQTFTSIGTLLTPRTNAVAAATPDGRVLIAGGADLSGAALASTEIFVYNQNTKSGTLSAGPIMTSPRVDATATTTYDGVAIIGGNNGQIDLGTAEIFSQWTNKLKMVSGGTPRSHHFAALLPKNGAVLAMGGTGGTAVDLLQPWANNKAGAFFAASNSLINQDGGFASPAVLGSLLTAGGKGTSASLASLYWFPTISTDKFDYAPGTPVHMTGTGFQPLETVTLHIHEWVKQSTDDDPDVTVTADSLGNFAYDGYAPDTDDIGARYHLTAIGMSSGYQAQVIFHDSITFINFSNAPLNQPAAPASGAATAAQCGNLKITVGGATPYNAIALSDSSNGTFYSSQLNCTNGTSAITSVTPTQLTTDLWYRNSTTGTPTVNACTGFVLLGICLGTGNSQTESIFGAPTQLVFAQEPGGGGPGVVWQQQPDVQVQDASYNRVGSNSDSITLTISTGQGNGTLTCTSNPLNASLGEAAFSGCKINNASTSCYVLKATDATLGFTATSSCFYISNPGDKTKSTVSANPTSVVDNGTTTSTITVTIKDLNGNPVVGKTVTLSANLGSSVISGNGIGVTNASGVVTFAVTDTAPETVTYTATDITDNVTVTQTAAVTFTPGNVSNGNSTITRNPATVNANGVAFSTITVTLNDANGNPVPSETVTLSQGTGHSVITTVSGTTNASGVATFTVTDTTVESVTYSANYAGTYGTGPLSGRTAAVNFTGTGTTLTLTVNPNNTTLGTSPIILTSGLSVTTGGAPLGGVAVSFYEAVGTCSAASTFVGTVNTDGTGTATFNWITTALPAGTYNVCAFSAQTTISNVTYLAASSGSKTLVVANAATTLAWTTAPLASATYNTTFPTAAASPAGPGHSPCTVSYAVSGGACSINNGTHVVTMTSGGGLPPGSQTCTVTATIAACTQTGTTYSSATISQAVTPLLATQATLNLNGVPATANDGATFTVSTSGGNGTGAVTFSTSTPTVCSVSGTQVTMTATASGQTCTVTATKASDGNYASATSASKSAVSNGTAIVTISNTSQTFTGSPLPVTVVTSPPGLAVTVTYTGTGATVYGPSTTAPTAVGTYSVTAIVTTPGVTGSATATETISQASSALSLALQPGTTNPSPYGTMDYFVLTFGLPCTPGSGPTGTVQLIVDGTPVVGATGVPDGSCAAVVLSTATIEQSPVAHQVSVQYSGDTNHPSGFSNTLFFTVSADTTQVTLSATATTITVGQSDTFTATVTPNLLAAGANGPTGTVQFLDGATVIDTETLPATAPYTVTFATSLLAAGTHSISAVYVPGGSEFSGSSSAITVTVGLNAPTITWPAPASIVYGTPLSAVQLNATATDPTTNATVPGTFVYTPAAGFVVGVGTTTLSVTFTPDPSVQSTYSTNSATVQITVTAVALTVTADPQTMVYGATVPTLTATITGFVAGDVPSQVTGAAACTITGATPYTVAGSPYVINCTQGTLAEPNYTFTTFVPGQLTVTAATPTLALVCPPATYDGNPHGCAGSALAVDGTSQVTGSGGTLGWTYTYNGSSTAPTAVGTYAVVATFTSGDTNYNSGPNAGVVNGSLVISDGTSSVTLTCPSSVPYSGAAQTPCSASATLSGGGTVSGLTVTYSNNINAGTATASATYAGDPNHTGSSNTVNFAIAPAAITVTGGTYSGVYTGAAATIPGCTLGGAFTGTLSCTESPTSAGPGVGGPVPVVPTIVGDTSNFTVITTNGSWTITPAASTVLVTCPSSVVYNGTAQQPCSATVKGVGGADTLNQSVSITYTSNIDVGTANASANFPGDANHSASSMSVNFAITAAAVTVTGGSYSGVYDGVAHALTNCTVVGPYIGNLVCTNNPLTEGPNVGSGAVTVSSANLTGDTIGDFAITYVPGSWSITKATSTVTVSCPASVTYTGSALTPCTAAVTGIGGLNQAVTPVTYLNNINAGTATASATFAGDANHQSDPGSTTFIIDTALVTATAGSLNGTYTGALQSPSACVITGAAIGVSTLTCSNSPASVGPGIGSGTVTPVISGAGQANFTINSVNGTYNIAALPVQITLGNLAQIFTGSPVAPVTVATVPTGVAVSVLYGTNGSPNNPTSTTPPSAVNSYTVTATTTNPNYVGFVSNTLVISSASSSLTLALRSGDSEPSLYGQFVHFDLPLSGTPCPTGSVQWVLNGVGQTPVVTLPATCSTPITYQTDTLVPGTYTLNAVFTSGDANYTSGTSNTVTHVVSADTTTVNLTATGTSLNVGQSVTFTAYVVPTAVPGSGALVPNGTVNFLDGATIIGTGTLTQPIPGLFLATFTTTTLAAGSHTISATYVPGSNGAEYPGSSSTVNVTVSITKIVPTITWATPGSIVYGTPLSATQLNATATDPNTDATVPGTFAYNPPAPTLVHAGTTNTLTATFTPTNGTVYTTNTATVNLVVTAATPTLSLACPVATYNGTPQQTCVGTATGVTGGSAPAGSWVYNPATETEAGTYSVTGTYTSTNTDYQGGGTATGTLTINKAPVTATAGSYSGVFDGATHSPSACIVTGSFIGGMTCTNSPASVGPGVSAGPVAPIESGATLADFAITEVNGSYSITKATSTVTVTCPVSVVYNGAAQTPCTATVTGAGGLSQAVTPVTYSANTNVGTVTASATFAGDANHSANTGTKTFAITAAPVTATAGSYNAAYDGAAHAPTPACVVTGTFKGNLTCANTPASVGPAVGAGTVTPTVSGTGLTNFAVTAANGTWSITKSVSTVTVTCPASVTFNGAAQTPCSATVTGPGLNQAVTPVTYTNNTNAGTATASASYAGDANHAAGTGSATFTINAVAVTATAGSFNGVYNGAARAPSACTLTGAFTGGLTCANNPASVGPAVGAGAVVPVVTGGSANFTITLVNGAWAITQATSTVTVTCTPASVVYNGAAQTPCTAAVTGAGGLNQAVTPVTYSNNTNVGTATASASYAGDTNHTASTGTRNFTITAAPVTATAGSYNAVYDGTAHAPAPACAVTGTFKGNLTCTNTPASVGPAVGAGTVTPTVSGTGLTNFTVTAVNGTWSITKAPSTVTVTCPATFVYNGAARTPCTATVTGVGGLNQAVTPVTYTNNTNVGTATASASYAGDANHAASTGTATFTITPAPVTATAGSYNAPYDGAAHAPTPACAVTGAFTGGLTCTNNPASVGPAVGAGTVTPTVTGGTLTNFTITAVNGTWSITKATSTVTVTCPASVTYNGAAQTPCTATVTSAGGFTQALTPTYTNNTNAGTATASASFAGDANHAAASNTANFTINATAVTATAGSYNAAYDGSAHAPTACTLTGAFTTGLTCTNAPASVGPGVGSGTVTPTVTGGSANFAITSVNGAWSITQAASTVTVTCPASVTYNGAAQTPCTATVTSAGGFTQALTPTYTNNTNAGTATATASFAGDTNHAAATNTANFTINAAAVTATAGSYNAAYDGSAHAPTACAVTGAFTGGLTCTNTPASVGPAVGAGTVTPTVVGGSANFTITSVNGAWSITKATSTVTVTCPASVTYNGAAQTPCTAAVTGAGGLSQTLTPTYTNNTNAGTATASASFAGDANHAAGSNSANFTIAPAAVTATAGSYNAAYDGSAHAPVPACAVTGAFTGGLTCTNNPASVGPAVGAGTVTPTVAGGTLSNFTITAVDGTWSITKATSTVTVSCPASVSYNGAAQTPCTATVTSTGGFSQSLTVTYTNNTNVGTATASASFAGDANHAAGSNSATFTIGAAAVTATAGSYNAAYDGSAHAPSACTVTGAFTGGLTCTNNPASVGPAVGAGTVTPTVSGGALSNFTITAVNGAWSITKATSLVTVTCPASVVYNGAAQTPCTATVTGSGGLSQSLAVIYTNNTNAGTATASASFAGDANHAAGSDSASFTIGTAAVTATAGSYTGLYDGSSHAPTACALTGAFTGGLTCTNNPASVGPAVGSGAVTPTVTGGTLANFTITAVNGAWSITKATSAVTVTCPASVVYNGVAQTPCTAAVTGSGGLNQPLTVTYTNNTNAGTATASASFAGDANHAAGNNSATFTIGTAAVTATAGNFSGVYNGAARTPSACTVTGPYTDSLTCANNPASVGPAVGSGTVVPVVSGGTLANFTITAVNGTWSITKATSSVAITCPASVIYSGAAQTPCTATVTGAGGFSQSLTVTYTNNTNVGTATASASFAGDVDHAASTNSTTFTIAQAVATVTLSNLAQFYTGSPLPVTVTTAPTGLSVTVLYSSATYPSSATAPTNPGSYTVTATVVNPNYTGLATGTLVISTASSGLTLQLRIGMPEPSPYGTLVYFDLGLGGAPCPTGTVQFFVDSVATGAPVTLSGASCTAPVTFGTATLTVGSHNVYAHYSGDALYTGGDSNHITHAVAANTTAVALATTATSLSVGQSVTFTATVTPTALDPSAQGPAGTVEFFDGGVSLGAPIALSSSSPYTAVFPTSSLAAGAHSISATYTSSNGEFTGSSSSIAVTVTVNKIAPTITWSNPANIFYGTALSGTQLNATATDATKGNIPVAGTFAYTPLSGTVLPVGAVNLVVNFTPTDTATYSSQSATVTLTVVAATPTLTLTCTEVTYDGNTHACTGSATGVGGAAVTGTWTYAPVNETAAGSYPVTGTFVSTDSNYQGGTAVGTLKIDAAPVTATAGSYNAVDDGAAHAPSACVVSGAFTGGLTCTNNPASVGPGVGSGTVVPVVTGGTLTNFAITTVNGTWNIGAPLSTVTTVTCPASVVYNGAAQTPCTATVTGSGGFSQTLTATYTNNTNAGTATANASFAGDGTHPASSNSATFAIDPAPVTATAGGYSALYDASAHAPSACAVTGAYTVGLSCANTPASVGPAVGSGAVTPTVTGGSANFAITSVNGAWSITAATSTVAVTCPASVIYNGAAQTPCTATVTGVGGLSQSVAVTYTSNINAGTATATANFAGDANHASGTNSATFTIDPAPVTATAGSYSGVVDASTHAPSACAVTGAYTTGLSCTNNPASVGPAVGSGTVVPVVSGGTANFAITAVNGTWNITTASSSVTTVSCPVSVVFNGAAQTPCTATVTGSGGLNQSLTVTYTNNTNAGTATANASFAGDATHGASSNSATFAINPAPVTATAGSYTGVVDASAHAPSACAVTGAYTVGLSCTNNPASVGPAVGSGTVVPVVTGGTLTNFAITPVNGAWSITAAATTVTTVTCPVSVVYNGAVQTPCTATVTGSGGFSQSLTVTYTNNINAGSASANASFAGDATHPASNGSANFAIDPAPVTATAGSYTGVVDASTHAPSACAVTGAFTGSLTCTNNPASVGPAVGSGTVVPVVTGGTLTNFAITAVNGAWSITQAPSTVAVTCPASVFYNGAAQAPCTAAVTGSGGLNQSVSVTYTSNTNAGTATANASFAGDASHAASSNSATFTINPAPVTATAGSYSGIVDASTHSPSACAVTGAYTVGLSCTNNPASVGPAVGSGTVAPVVTGSSANFAVTSVNGTWNITSASSTVTTVTCPVSVLYNGAAQTPCTATVTGSGGFSQSLTVTYTSNTNAGTATANASFAGDATHPASNGSANFAINPAPVTATAGSYSGIVDASTHSPSACAVTGAYTVGLSCTNNPASVGPAVGSGTVAPVVTGGSANFAITSVNGSWSITAATSTLTTVTCPVSVLYNGAAQTPCTATVTGSGGFSQALTVTYSSNTNAGTATANASFAGDATHPASNGSANFAINPAPVTATAGSYNAADDGSAHAPSACAVTGAYTVGLSCTNNPASVGPGVGSGTVAPVVSGGTANFAITAVNGSWTITAASSTSTTTAVTCPVSVVYNGAAQAPCTATVTGSGGFTQTLTVTYTNNINPGTATANASFAGDATHTASSNSATFTIAKASQAITFAQPTTPVIYGVSPIALVATGGASGKPVVFSIDPSSTGSGTIAGTILTVTGAGNLVINANQAGDSNYLAATQVTRAIIVTQGALNVAANNASRVYGTANPVFTGNVTGAANGDVFTETFATVATITSNAGTYPIVPSVTGANLAAYTVAVQNGIFTITQAGTATTMTTSGASVTPGQSVTLTAQVASVTTGTPTGTVAFFNGTALLATVPLTAGTATLSTSALTPGSTNTLQAVYSGDINFTTSSSATSPVSVAALDFAVAITGASAQTVTAGTTATFQLAVTPLYGNYPGTVSFAASGLPSNASITFSPTTIAANGGKQTVTVSIHTTAIAMLESPSTGRNLAPLALALLFIPLFGVGRLRRQGRRLSRLASLLLLLGCAIAGVTMSGCGGKATFKQIEQNYGIVVTATSGSMQHTAPVSLTVK